MLKVYLIVIAIVALVGNSLTVLLFIRKSKWLKKAHSCLIFALSIQDILLAICLLTHPAIVLDQDVYEMPSSHFARVFFCSFLWSHYFPFALGVTSVYTCLMLTIDRWLAVLKPLAYKSYEHSAKVIATMVTIPWIVGFAIEITSPLNAKPTEIMNGTVVCSWQKFQDPKGRVALAIFSLLGMIVIPALLMVVAYVHIIIHLKRSTARVSVRSRSLANTGRFRSVCKRVTLTAFFASVIVVVCWLPDQLYYALSQVGITELGTPVHSAVKILAFANSCVNPFLYSFSNKEYRKGLKEMIFFACVQKEQNIGVSMQEYNSRYSVSNYNIENGRSFVV